MIASSADVATSPHPHRFVYLVAAQLALIVLYPFVAGDTPAPGVFGVFAIPVFIAALWAIASERRVLIVAAALGSAAIVGNSIRFTTRAGGTFLPGILVTVLFLGFVTAVIVRRVVLAREITIDTLYGAVTAYLFLGVTWGMAYGFVGQLEPGSFRSLVATDGRVAWPAFTFFSFITLTSVGYGDIVPSSGAARTLAMLEAITGVMYQALLIARLVGLHGQRGTRASD